MGEGGLILSKISRRVPKLTLLLGDTIFGGLLLLEIYGIGLTNDLIVNCIKGNWI